MCTCQEFLGVGQAVSFLLCGEGYLHVRFLKRATTQMEDHSDISMGARGPNSFSRSELCSVTPHPRPRPLLLLATSIGIQVGRLRWR